MRYAVIDSTGKVENVILASPEVIAQFIAMGVLTRAEPSESAMIGDLWEAAAV